MKSLRSILLGLLLSTPALADPAFDFYSTSGGVQTGNFDWSHAAVGTARGVAVACMGEQPAETITATYGGVSLTHTSSSPFSDAVFSETAGLVIYMLHVGSSLPTGTQTIAITKDAAGDLFCGAWTATATGNTEVQAVNTAIDSASVADPTSTISLGGNASFVAQLAVSGHGLTGSVTPPANWTQDQETDLGSLVFEMHHYDIVGATDVAVGWTQTAEDAFAFSIAVRQAAALGGAVPLITQQH